MHSSSFLSTARPQLSVAAGQTAEAPDKSQGGTSFISDSNYMGQFTCREQNLSSKLAICFSSTHSRIPSRKRRQGHQVPTSAAVILSPTSPLPQLPDSPRQTQEGDWGERKSGICL